MVRTSGYKYLKQEYGVLCRKLPAESIESRLSYSINHLNDVYSGGSESEISRRSWIQMILHSTCILAANRGCMHFCTIVEHRMTVSMSLRWFQRWASTKHQRFIVISILQSHGWIVASIWRRSIRRLSRDNGNRHTPCPIIEMSVNGGSTISGLISWIISGLGNGI
jgi:hypothetical protein